MLQPRLLPKVLEQINTDGIKTTILCNVNGSLISSASTTNTTSANSSEQQLTYQQHLLPSQLKHLDKLVAAIAANMWYSYQKAGKTAFSPSPIEYDENGNVIEQEPQDQEDQLPPQELKCLLADCEYGRMAITGVSRNVVLCVCAEKNVPFGLLNKKTTVLREYLSEPFKIIDEAIEEEEEEEF
ncbi:predicted protein [Naegleria gruberi]|uniref:Predicted protein n=1 Tax=Naegleria gruberi TaxID=5762 RepID=D2VMS1_NAEGR|nr:uncharacterized protein NAEGRDRAFT_50840 [Naegleria gruberi]EFC41784.1 predicted protein [Naegleria gruberi]|eukprot:XP_002674528.1 predicted protein [Naegleria gruberi strain NEG-M]